MIVFVIPVSTRSDNASSEVYPSDVFTGFVMSFLIFACRDGEIIAKFRTYFRSGFFLYVPCDAAKICSGVSL